MTSKPIDNPVFLDDEETVIRNTKSTLPMDGSTVESQHGGMSKANANDEDEEADEDEEDDDYDYSELNACGRFLLRFQSGVSDFFISNKTGMKWLCVVAFLLFYLAYFSYAMYYHFGDDGSLRLLVCTAFGVFLLFLNFLPDRVWQSLNKCCVICSVRPRIGRVTRWSLYLSALIAIVLSLIFKVANENPGNLLSLAGIAAFIVITFITSSNPARVDWHPVFWGLSFQYFFALIILRLDWGYQMFKYLGDRVTEFMNYSQEGAQFVFGDSYQDHRFAFSVLPVMVFFSTAISVLYHLGVMQAIIRVIGRAFAFLMGTTPAESINAAANIFVGMSIAPLMIRPFLPKMTRSELHAVLTGGFATIAGSVLAAYITFGVPASHLISASVMSAPAALAVSKLTCPETQKSKATSEDYNQLQGGDSKNVIEALSNGATLSIKLVSSVAVNIMAFLSSIKFVNATLGWFGSRVGVPHLSFEFICSYLLYPVALFMGVEPTDCRAVAQLVGTKTFANEFIAYSQLSGYLKNREMFENYTITYNETDWIYHNDDIVLTQWNNQTLAGGILSPRSEVISTYALCGFSNFGSMGIMLGVLSALAPRKKHVLTTLILRAMIAGNIACFMTGCIAGLMFKEF